jgi:hypothetical protein
MKIQSLDIINTPATSASVAIQNRTSPQPKKSESPSVTTEASPETDAPKVPGVVRLLNEGHFKPVADIRLRLNFADLLDTTVPLQTAENVHGKAYAKFLAQYQQLYGPPEEPETEPVDPESVEPSDTIDITA